MSRPHLRRVALAVLTVGLVAGASGRADAGLVVVSGDSNITAALTGVETSINAGNQQFFRNVLGSGTRVLVASDLGQFGTLAGYANTYYNTLAGVTSTLTTSPITAANLVGVNLFLSIGRETAYSASEISLLNAFSAAGGTVLIAGDGTNFETIDATANALLTGIGSSLRITAAALDSGYQIAPASRIAANALTAGVSSFTYAYTGFVTGGTTLITTSTNQTFLASAVTPSAAVPEPSSLALTAIAGLAGLGLRWRQRRALA